MAWCSKLKLIPNCDRNKTECLIIQPSSVGPIPNITPAPQPLKIGNKIITYATQSKVLGLIIDDKLSFMSHAKQKLKQCWFTWHRLVKKSTRYYGLNASSLVKQFI